MIKDLYNLEILSLDKNKPSCDFLNYLKNYSYPWEILNDIGDMSDDGNMYFGKKLPNQYVDAQKFYEKVRKDFPNQEIVFTGHSLGGSLAKLMSNKTGHETVTFNAYGIRDILQGYVRDNLEKRLGRSIFSLCWLQWF